MARVAIYSLLLLAVPTCWAAPSAAPSAAPAASAAHAVLDVLEDIVDLLLSSQNGRIVGGESTDIQKVPYQVSIEQNKALFCGGSVLSSTWVLTAAHCVYGIAPKQLQVRAGTDKRETGGSVSAVQKATSHPKYIPGVADWDVAVLHLATPLKLGATIRAVKLPASGREPSVNSPVVASGWGLISPKSKFAAGARSSVPAAVPGADLPKQLRKVTLRVVARTQCHSAYASLLTQRMICAGAPGKDACTYDSGGPLVDQQGVQVGVVSWGKGCADAAHPGVYVHLGNADIRAFVKSQTGGL